MSEAEHPTKKKNWFAKHKVLSVVIALVVLAIIGASTSGNKNNSSNSNSSTSSSNSSNSAANTQSSTAGLNQEADDGDFGFTATGLQCGQATLSQPDNASWTSTAQGQFCTLNLSIKNVKTQAQQFDDSAQYVYSASGTQYSPDGGATITANPSGSNCDLFPTINPGNTLTCVVAFDVPKGTTPAYAMLHDSSASGGVKVNLQ